MEASKFTSISFTKGSRIIDWQKENENRKNLIKKTRAKGRVITTITIDLEKTSWLL